MSVFCSGNFTRSRQCRQSFDAVMKERILITKENLVHHFFSIKAFRFVFNLSFWKLFWPTLSKVCVRAEWPVRPVRLARIFKKLNQENWSFTPSNLTYLLLLTHRLYIWLWFFPFWHNQGRIQKGGGTKLWLTTDNRNIFGQITSSRNSVTLPNKPICWVIIGDPVDPENFSVKQVVKNIG